MARRTWVIVGALVLAFNTVQWVVAEAIAARAWSNPSYSYANNYISDLGVPDCGTEFQGRELCSPMHNLMNTSFVAQGLLFALGVILLSRLFRDRARAVVTVLAVAHAIGFVLVGTFQGSLDGPSAGLVLHVAGAGVGILAANAIAIIAGTKRGLSLPKPYRVFSVVVGALGLVSEALVNLSPDTAGLFERGGVYSWLLWGLVTAVLLFTRELRGEPVAPNVEAHTEELAAVAG